MYTSLKIKLLIFVLAIIMFPLYSQNQTDHKLSGYVVTDSLQLPISFATVLLKNNGSKSSTFGAISNNDGYFYFDTIPDGDFLLEVSYLGYYPIVKAINKEVTHNIGVIKLKQNSINCKEVSVIAHKPGIYYDANKTVFIPDQRLINASKIGFDIINKVPNVHIDPKDNTITVGRNGSVLLLINGVQSTRDMFSINPKEIKRIELIKNPGVEYGSEEANIINIVLKDNFISGLSTTLNTRFSFVNELNNSGVQGVYGNDKVTLFSGYRLSHYRETDKISITDREYEYGDEYQTYNTESDDGSKEVTKHTFNAGMDFNISDKSYIHVSGNITPYTYKTGNTFDVSFNDNGSVSDYVITDETVVDALQQKYAGVYRNEFSKNDQVLEFNTEIQMLDRESEYYNEEIDDDSTESGAENTNTDFNRIVSKLTYKRIVFDKWQLNSGGLFYLSQTSNKTVSESEEESLDCTESRSNVFTHMSYKNEKISLKFGLGVEYRDLDIKDYDVNNHQLYMLPSVFTNYKINSSNTIAVSYRKLLSYPSYYISIPYEYYSSDSLSVTSGNANLKPMVYTDFNVSHNFSKDDLYLISSMWYAKKKDTQDITYSYEDGVLVGQWNNIDDIHSIGGSVEAGTYMFDLLDLSFEGYLFYNFYPESSFNGWSREAYASFEMELPYDFTFGGEISFAVSEHSFNGNYNSELYIDLLTLNKNVFRNNGSFTLMATNPFLSLIEKENYWDNYFKETSYTEDKATYLSLRFIYRFNNKLERKRKTHPSLLNVLPN